MPLKLILILYGDLQQQMKLNLVPVCVYGTSPGRRTFTEICSELLEASLDSLASALLLSGMKRLVSLPAGVLHLCVLLLRKLLIGTLYFLHLYYVTPISQITKGPNLRWKSTISKVILLFLLIYGMVLCFPWNILSKYLCLVSSFSMLQLLLVVLETITINN